MELKKTLILCAGYGTRLRPLTYCRPKALVPVFNKPIVTHILDRLQTIGLKEFAINIHHLHKKFQNFPSIYNHPQIDFFHESKLLDTGGAIKHIKDFIKEETILVHNGDTISNINIKAMYKFHTENQNIVTMALSKNVIPHHITIDKKNLITYIGPAPNEKRRYGFMGIQIIDPELLNYIPSATKVSVIPIYKQLIKDGKKIMGYIAKNCYWNEIGTVESYKKIHFNPPQYIKSQNPNSQNSTKHFSKKQNIYIGKNCFIDDSCYIKDSILWDNVKIKGQCKIENSIITDNSVIENRNIKNDIIL